MTEGSKVKSATAHKKFQAEQLFTGEDILPEDHVLITDENGKIEDIVLAADAGDNVQRMKGILSPGFINCHCHLELSHLKNIVPPHTGLIEFLCSVVTKRETATRTKGGDLTPAEARMQSIVAAEREMHDNGVVAAGDIGNTADTAATKAKSKIYWHNFVEVLSFTDEKAEENIIHFKSVLESLEEALALSGTPHRSSLVPHAPYSISPKSFKMINQLTAGQIISMHNQEHPAEDELYKNGGGDFMKLFEIFGVYQSPFPVTGKSSIRSCLPFFNNGQTVLLIHNTYMPEEDIVFANEYANSHGLSLFYCLCPNANLYIEDRLPPVHLFIKHNCRVVLGTDSYSSNWQLNMAKEIGAIASGDTPRTPGSLKQYLQWATINGARALRWDDKLGSFEKGKTPGVALLNSENWTSERLV